MPMPPSRLRPVVLALLSLAPLVRAQAQTATPAAPPRTATLPTVTVEGGAEGAAFAPGANSISRLPADPMDTPQSITVITKPLMESQGATSLASALRNVPGLTIGAAEGGQIGTNINLNGFSARTDVYLDGMRDRGQYYRDIFGLDSVEVLMGPSSMLFGRGSTGGVINQVTKKPGRSEFGEVSASATSNGLLRTTADINRPLSETSAFRIAAMAQDGDATSRDQNKVRDVGIAPSIAFGMGTPTQVTATALLQHNHDMPDYGLPPLNGAPAKVDRDTAYGFTDDRTISDIASVALTVQHKLTPVATLRNQTQYNDVRTNAIETAPQGIGTRAGGVGPYLPLSTGTTAAPITPTSTLPLDQLWVRQQSHDRTIHDKSLYNLTEYHTTLDQGTVKHALLAGLELGADDYRNQAYYRNGTCGGAALNPAGGTSGYVACTTLVDPVQVASPGVPETAGNLANAHATTTAAFLNDTASLGEQWKLVAGARYDRYRASIDNSVPSATVLASESQTVNYTSVRGGVIYQPTHAQSFYASYSTSFNPSLEQLVATTGATQPLPPQENRALEAGMKWDVLDGDLSTNAAVFRITQYNARSQNNDGTYSATGTVRVDGLRAGASGRLTKALQLFAAYTHLDATIVDAIAPATQGKVPANTPKDSANLWLTYALTPEWEVGGGANYVASRYANNTDFVRVPGYTRFDAVVAYHQPRYDIRLNLFNLGNKYYYDSLIPSDGGRAVPGLARSAMVSATYRF